MYNVYAITDGICHSEVSYNKYERAVSAYYELIAAEIALKSQSREYAETTINLFDAAESSMNLLAEFTVEGR